MIYQAIDSLFVAVADLAAAISAYERLGVRLARSTGATFSVGVSPNLVRVELIPADATDHALAMQAQRAHAAGRGLFAVGLRVGDLASALAELAGQGLAALPLAEGRWAWLPVADRAGADLVLIEREAVFADMPAVHAFPLRRLDHLAAVAPDLDAKTSFWASVLGVPVTGEVVTPTMIIRQLRIGDAIFELLAPASPDSPLHARQPGLSSLASWEVADLAGAVQQARAAGFTAPDPAPGALPGTRTATIPAAELAGLTLQLLERDR